jgi:hypothetical protein
VLDYWNQKVVMETMVLNHCPLTLPERDDLTLVVLAASGLVCQSVYFENWELLFWQA